MRLSLDCAWTELFWESGHYLRHGRQGPLPAILDPQRCPVVLAMDTTSGAVLIVGCNYELRDKRIELAFGPADEVAAASDPARFLRKAVSVVVQAARRSVPVERVRVRVAGSWVGKEDVAWRCGTLFTPGGIRAELLEIQV